MGKDPAFLFYSKDFFTSTVLMTDEQVGKYIRLLCIQHQNGHIEENHMLNICKSYDKYIFSKFERDENGLYYNKRLEIEVNRRANYCESRRKNKLSGKTYDKHMGTGTATGTENRKRKPFIKPTIEEVEKFFDENGYDIKVGRDKWHYYNDANWFDSKGNPVLNWKQKMRSVWFRDEYKKKDPEKLILSI